MVCEPSVLSCVISRFLPAISTTLEFADVTSEATQKLQWCQHYIISASTGACFYETYYVDISHVYSTNVCKTWHWTNISTNKTSSKHFQQLKVSTGPSLLSTVHRGQGRPLLQGMREHFQHVLQQRKFCANVGGTWVFSRRENKKEMIIDRWWLKMCWFCCWNGFVEQFWWNKHMPNWLIVMLMLICDMVKT